MITFATDIMRPLVTSETEILRHQHQTKREQNLYSMRSWIRGSRISKACDQRSCRITEACDQRSCRISAAWVQGVFQNFCSMKSRGLAEFLQHDIEGSCRISAARHRGFLQNFCSVISRGQQNFCSMTPRIKGSCRISATWDQGGRRISPAWDQGVLQNLLSPLRRFCW